MNRETLEKLYIDGFPADTAAYRNWFIDRYRDYAVTVDDVACGYLVEKQAVVAGRKQTVFYIDAFCVATPYRGKGYARPLMQKLLIRARNAGATYVLLSPFSSDYYKRFGFVDVAFGAQYAIGGGDAKLLPCTADELRARYNRGKSNRLLLDRRAADAALESYAVDGLQVVRVGDSVCGAIDGARFDVLCAGDETIACDALNGLTAKIPAVQARVVDAEKAYEDAKNVLFCNLKPPCEIVDPLVESNNVRFGAGSPSTVDALAACVFGRGETQIRATNRFFDEV